MPIVDANTELLRAAARIQLDKLAIHRFIEAINHIEDWPGLLAASEHHGLSPLIYHHLNESGISIPTHASLTLKALAVRHRRAHDIRTEVITEFLARFAQEGIECLLLKGAALAHLLYPEPSMRPMGDVDILVHRDDALDAQQCLRELGYSADDRKQGYLYDHHHLPIASHHKQGMGISLEVHHDALSGDVASSIAFHNLTEPATTFQINGQAAQALGHLDTLRHLCHHTFEPAETIKLGSIADLVGYASKYAKQIDWVIVADQFPMVINTLRCTHFLNPLPQVLIEQMGAPRTSAPQGVGRGFRPMSTVIAEPSSRFDKIKTLLSPPNWWMHIHYVVPPEQSLVRVRYWKHPWQVAKWLARRYKAKYRSHFKH